MKKLFYISLGFTIGFGLALYLIANAQTKMTASVGLTPDNCWTTYQVNKSCIDLCVFN